MVQTRKKYGKLLKALCFLAVLFLCSAVECRADLKSSDALQNSEWTLLTEYEIGNNTANLQAMCSTDKYVVCLINASNAAPEPDTLVAFYKGSTDENGNEVRPYSYAKSVTEMDYEHGNGMAYNPYTRELVIAGGRNLSPENKGCLFIVDADTLKFKRKVKISDDWNVQAIDFSLTNNNYLIQKSGDGGFGFVEADLDFNITNELGDMIDLGGAGTFQDLCVCGDDIISIPYNKNTKYNGTVQVYSRKEQQLLGQYQLSLASDSEIVEAESISELSPGSFVLGCAIRNPRRIALYGATLPMAYNIETSIENGTITESAEGIDLGSDYTIEYQPIENYEVKEITVDDQPVTVREYKESYLFSSLTRDHRINVICTEIPKFEIETDAVNGTIDEKQLIYRDKDVTVEFAPDEHYEIDKLVVDGKDAVPDKDQTSVTFKKIKTPHSVSVTFKEIPAYMVTAEAKNGTVSKKASRVYSDENYTVSFKPAKDYVLKNIYVDGVKVKHIVNDEEFTFANIQRPHDIQVIYVWKYTVFLWVLCAALAAVGASYVVLSVKRFQKKKKRRAELEVLRIENRVEYPEPEEDPEE
ncbi:InlB B-repeat-containing protein [Ruminococcus gauvreauii]|uniref:Bacterial repeat domain-containing protein n=1 Tax=Ruminococcus gauvreauii TaxID=438033 RepID=A0ABY5VDU2_9FIRM|nr:hypothetical protein [Ruminococcus gauvreauii]UWP58402.1 hypothetical protein NQ502_13545 [Ruminococcus gauvreauii]